MALLGLAAPAADDAEEPAVASARADDFHLVPDVRVDLLRVGLKPEHRARLAATGADGAQADRAVVPAFAALAAGASGAFINTKSRLSTLVPTALPAVLT